MKWCGEIGFVTDTEIEPGLFVDGVVVKRKYRGDVERLYKRTLSTDKLTTDLTLSNSISIVMDAFLNENLSRIKFISFMGAYWYISDVEVRRPRLILTLGGLYNGEVEQAETAENP